MAQTSAKERKKAGPTLQDAITDTDGVKFRVSNDTTTCEQRNQTPFRTRCGKQNHFLLGTFLLALICLVWVVWIMLLTSAPDKMANVAMKTADLDFGEFWRFSPAPTGVVVVGLVGLAVVGLSYVSVLHKLVRLMFLTTAMSSNPPRHGSKIANSTVDNAQQQNRDSSSKHWSAKLARRTSSLTKAVLDKESVTRRRLHTAVKVADLVIQCVFLAQLLEQGMHVSLLTVFAAIVVLNGIAGAIMFILRHDNVGRAQTLVDTFFDFMVAIVFPVLVLLYTLNTFTFDREAMKINDVVFLPGAFEHNAVVVADPVQVENIRTALDSLRIDSVLKIFTRVGTHLALVRRFFGLVQFLEARKSGVSSHPNVYPKNQRPVAAFFFAVAVAVVVYTAGSVYTSDQACRPHPECVQISRSWVSDYKPGQLDRCPCLALIDNNVTIATYEEWTKPQNRTEKLAQLAHTGYLQTVQLVNRELSFFPEQLRRCKNLKHVSLYYTHTLTLPDWFGDFTNLEFLHIEGKAFGNSIQELPPHLFDRMSKLSYVHLAMLAIPSLPSLDGLVNLRSFMVAALPLITELPSFSHLRNLERLTITSLPGVEVFPDLTNVKNLKALAILDRGTFCCNGFLGADKCDLNRSLCRVNLLFGTPAVTSCLSADRVATAATRKYFDKFNYSACYGEVVPLGQIKFLPTREEMIQCNGTLYRECVAPGHNGSAMCYNARWMGVACDPSPFAIRMRQLQIAERVGKPCNPEYEAWLGCKK